MAAKKKMKGRMAGAVMRASLHRRRALRRNEFDQYAEPALGAGLEEFDIC
ncbi:MAG TPA: hypothetical protein PLV61_01800 [Parvularculaceae bacterium]|nr:hypothetical protein [Amphiplicatus sp.]HPE29893.1 hypothetical protein [Parvularculaceae bacterium]